MKRIVIDLDHTICTPLEHVDQTIDRSMIYVNAEPNLECIKRLREYKAQGFEIVVYTSRNMRTFAGDIEQIKTHTLPIVIDWLTQHDVPYDEVVVGKYWCGTNGFYIDDRAIRPSEFISKSHDEILVMLENEKALVKK